MFVLSDTCLGILQDKDGQMKIIVDKLPDNPSTCLFSKASYDGNFKCRINDYNLCSVWIGRNCPYCEEQRSETTYLNVSGGNYNETLNLKSYERDDKRTSHVWI